MIPLFRYYPLLGERLPYISLSGFPTPVQKLEHLSSITGVPNLYIKRDDIGGRAFGGNKIRKFEFMLGQALQSGRKELLTFGFAGANNTVAIAVTAQQAGLKSISMMMPEPLVPNACSNLLMTYACGFELHHQHSKQRLILEAAYQLVRHKIKRGSFPQFISGRKSTPLGTTGFVNAAFELKEQVTAGEIPEPDYIYVAKGSGGTATGLMLGIRAANLHSRVVAVSAKPEEKTDEKKLDKLYDKTASLLHSLDPSFPKLEFPHDELEIRYDFVGKGYACPTEEGLRAIGLIEKHEEIRLDSTYTGKAFACLLADAEKGYLKDKVALFWDTCNSRDFSNVMATIDYHRLPPPFHRYFKKD